MAPANLEGTRAALVDDDPDHLLLFGLALEHCGATVHAFSTVADAARAIPKFRPDVVVSDILMAHDGYNLIGVIRKLEIPAIALSASAREVDRQAALGAGYVRFLAKPVHPEDLCEAVAEVLERRRM